MLSLFLTSVSSTSLKPLILIPGLYGSPLFGQANSDYHTKWYCPGYKDRKKYWVDLKLALPPVYNCLFQMMTVHYNSETDQLESQIGFHSTVEDFGGSGGIEYVDSSFFNLHFIESFHSFADFLRGKGYEFKKNLFGCPYDWRFGMAGLTPLFGQIKALVEEAYEKNNKEKVTLLGYSLGGYVSQHFLSNYTDADWKAKYIRRVVFLAPAFGGSGDTLVPAYTLRFPIVKFITSENIRQCLGTMPVLHALFPNHVVFGDKPVVIGPDGNVVATAATWGQFLIDQGKLSGDGIKIFEKNLWFNQHTLEDPGVDVTFLYNSGIETDFALRFKDGWDKSPEVDTIAGDGTVPVDGILWAIKNWDHDSHAINFKDFQMEGDDWKHGGLGKNDAVAELIYEAAIEEIPSSGVQMTVLPHYAKVEGKWVPNENVRKLQKKNIENVDQLVQDLTRDYAKVSGHRQLSPEESGEE